MGNFREIVPISLAANGFLLPLTDVSSFKWVSVHFGTAAFSGTINFLGSNDGVNTTPIELFQGNSTSSIATSTGSPTNVIWHGPVYYRYFALQVASYVSGITSAVVELYENVAWYVQNGVFLIPGNNNIGNVGILNMPLGAAQQNSSATATNATATATLTGALGKSTYLTGFEISDNGGTLTAATVVVSGVVGGPLTYEYDSTVPMEVEFTMPLQSSAQNTNITVAVGALGTGVIGSAVAHGYTL